MPRNREAAYAIAFGPHRRDDQPDPEQKAYTRVIIEEADRLAALVDGILRAGGAPRWVNDKTFRLPRRIGYGVSVDTPEGVVCAGGHDAERCYADVFMLSWDATTRELRRNPAWLFILSIFINIGMWFERFVIVIPSLSHEFEPWQWGGYAPTWVDYFILIGSFGWFFMWFLLFIKQMPVVALAEIKEIIPPKMRGGHARAHQAVEHGGMGSPQNNNPPMGPGAHS